jgi:carboxyl-terminal processing protease
MKPFVRGLLSGLGLFLLLAASFIGGYTYHQREFQAQDFPILDQAFTILKSSGLKEPPPDLYLEYGMIRGMMQAYNEPHSYFVDPPQHELSTQQLEGKYGGIGVQMNRDEQGYWVIFPYPDSPAVKAGLLEGDRLLAVDDISVDRETSAETISAAVRGPVGEWVRLSVGRPPDYEALEIEIQRAEVAIPSVTWRLNPDEPRAGVIKVNLMAATTADEIERAIADLQTRQATHFILDLRDNPGGYLTAGVDVARLFLTSGVVLEQQYRDRDVESFRVEKPGPLSDLPLAALINTGSASAAEIVAGALQAYQRAPMIGVHTYGKDTIQLVFVLSDQSSLHLTAARWWIPELQRPLGSIGVQPDILVDPQSDASGVDLVLQAALNYFFGN